MTGTDPSAPPAGESAPQKGFGGTVRSGLRYLRSGGVVIVFVAMIIAFSIARPDSFPTFSNARTILFSSVALGILAIGLTVVLSIGQFDLSIGAVVGISGAGAVLSMANGHVITPVAVMTGILVGGTVGVCNGLIVAYGRVPAFIGTLAVGSIATGIERGLTLDNTIYQGVHESYAAISRVNILGVPASVSIWLGSLLVIWVLLDLTVFGRRILSIGANEEAARLAGVRTARVKMMAFVVLGLCGGLTGVIVTAQAFSSYPNSGTPLLLPAYAAAFLGSSVLGGARFHPLATVFGVLFTGTLATGLIMLEFPSWSTNVLQGVVLAFAVLLARLR